jgi:hypothetical protein
VLTQVKEKIDETVVAQIVSNAALIKDKGYELKIFFWLFSSWIFFLSFQCLCLFSPFRYFVTEKRIGHFCWILFQN